MNIIKHLTHNVTSVVCTTEQEKEEIAVLEEFYSIVLARMTDTKAYNQLTKNNKLPTKKLTLYKVINNVSWNKGQSAQQIITKLAKNHNLDEEKVKSLIKQVTPRMFAELKNLSEKKPIPAYLKNLLSNPETSFKDYIPSWALVILPENLFENELDAIKDINNTELETKKSALKESKTHTSDSKNSKLDELESKESEKATTNSSDNSISITVEKQLSQKQTGEAQETDSNKSEDKDSNLPKAVHADPSDYSFENISNKLPESILDEEEKNSNRFLPLVGLAVIAILFWALLRGCQSSTDDSQSLDQSNTNTDIIALNKDTKSNDISTMNLKRHTTLIMSTDQSGQLLHAEIFTGNASITNNIKDNIRDIFDEKSMKNVKVTIDKKLTESMPTNEKLSDLISLIKDIPNTTIKITGNSIVFNTPDEKKQQELINEAQFILSGFKVSSGNENIQQGTDDNSNINDKKVSKLLKLQANDLAVVKLKQAKPKTQTKLDPKPEEKNKIEAKRKDSSSDQKLDVTAEVNRSISRSKQALDKLGKDVNLEALEKALNLQIINFPVNENKIPKENQAILNQAAKILKRANARLKIIGHTDSDGDAEYNKRLSQDRSFAVKKYLMSQGMKSENMTTDGVGESDPIANNSTLQGKFHNRRIEFKIYQSKKTN